MTAARVIGAGLSGLATAWCLRDAGFAVDVMDAAAAPGGLIRTLRTPEGPVERAANAFVWTETTARWFQTLGIEPRFGNDQSRKRYIFRDGRPQRWPLGAGETAAMLARVATAWARRRLRPRDRESVAEWTSRVAGATTTRWMVGPALQGIYATPPERLSARAIASGMFGRQGERRPRRSRKRPSTVAPPGGMGEFIDRLRDRLEARGVTFTLGRAAEVLDPSVPTVVCTDARSAAHLVAPHAPALAQAIGAVSMTSMATATVFFPPRADDLRGFGVLFPRGSGVVALGARFNSDIFEAQSAARSETWIYGSADDANPLPAERDMASQILRDRRTLTGHEDAPLAMYFTRVGDRARASADGGDSSAAPGLPVYGPAILDVADRLGDLPPWLALAGNYLGRLGVAKLLDVASEAAARLGQPGAA